MLERGLSSLILVWQESLVGGMLILACSAVGWRLGRVRDRWMIRVVGWWLQHVVGPLLASRSWSRRTVIIAANNSLICAAVVGAGALGYLAWLAVAGIGLGLGIALRLMIAAPMPDQRGGEVLPRHRGLLHTVGLGLNLLEVPAIMLGAGLSLAQGAMSPALGSRTALETFVLFVFPMLVVSAAGEALWMTVDPEFPQLPRPMIDSPPEAVGLPAENRVRR